jgi:cell wall-associated NlpC family hydrolase
VAKPVVHTTPKPVIHKTVVQPPVVQTESFNAKVVKAAESQLGVPYVWGGTTPGVAFDCSGLVQYAYEQAGRWIPRVTQDQYNFFRSIPKSEARPGDLVFFHTTSDPASYVYHVGIFLGGNDMMVVAPAPGNNVQIQNFDWGGDTLTFGTLDIS